MSAKPRPGRPAFLKEPVKINVFVSKSLFKKLEAKVNRQRKTNPAASTSSALREALEAYVQA